MLKRLIKWLTDKFSKTPSNPLPQLGKDFEFVDFPEAADIVGVKILDGKYAGVIYYYGKVKLIPREEPNAFVLSFDYTLYEIPMYQVIQDEEFKQYIGDILSVILMSDKGEYATARDLDSQESDLQRSVYAESDSVPQDGVLQRTDRTDSV